MAEARSSKARERGAGIPWRWHSSRAHTFDPSIRAASLVGPNTGIPRDSISSTSPATSGASGPTTVRSTDSRSANSTRPGMSPAETWASVASSAIPALPGAA